MHQRIFSLASFRQHIGPTRLGSVNSIDAKVYMSSHPEMQCGFAAPRPPGLAIEIQVAGRNSGKGYYEKKGENMYLGCPRYVHNTILCLGEMVAAIPLLLFRPSTPLMGSCSGFLDHPSLLLRQFLEDALPDPIEDHVVKPNPSTFVSACLILGFLVTIQYHMNESNRFQKPMLLFGLSIALTLSAVACSPGSHLVAAATSIPSTTILCLSLSQIVEAIIGCCKVSYGPRLHYPCDSAWDDTGLKPTPEPQPLPRCEVYRSVQNSCSMK